MPFPLFFMKRDAFDVLCLMSMESEIRRAINATLLCMPPELSALISEYGARQLHKWNADGQFGEYASLVSVVNKSAHVTELKIGGSKDQSYKDFRFVSEVSLADGHCEWSIETVRGVFGGAVRAGVTTSTCSEARPWNDDVGDRCELVATSSHGYPQLQCFINNKRIDVGHVNKHVTKFWFSANPSNGTIRVRWRAGGVNQRHRGWLDRPCEGLKTSSARWVVPVVGDRSIFESIRPCVVLSESTTVIVNSSPQDIPVKCQEILISTKDC